jgi:hypothetical protein
MVGKKLNFPNRSRGINNCKNEDRAKNDRDLVLRACTFLPCKEDSVQCLGRWRKLAEPFALRRRAVSSVTAIFVDWESVGPGMRLYRNPSELPRWSF